LPAHGRATSHARARRELAALARSPGARPWRRGPAQQARRAGLLQSRSSPRTSRLRGRRAQELELAPRREARQLLVACLRHRASGMARPPFLTRHATRRARPRRGRQQDVHAGHRAAAGGSTARVCKARRTGRAARASVRSPGAPGERAQGEAQRG
jgi:hypothetical protein